MDEPPTAKRFANLMLGGGALICTLALAYVVIVYDVLRIARTGSGAGLILYHVLPAVAAVLLVASLRLADSKKINLALVLASVALTLYALELGLIITAPPTVDSLRAAEARRTGANYDDRSGFEVVKALRESGQDAYPNFTAGMRIVRARGTGKRPTFLVAGKEFMPLAGVANKVVVLGDGNESGYWATYKSDKYGFNNPDAIWSLPRLDIAILGDSYAQGIGAPSGRGLADVIRTRHPATLNLGMGGEGPLLAFAKLEEYLPALKPRVVLWFFFEGNDLCDIRWERTEPILMRYLEGGYHQDLVGVSQELSQKVTAEVDERMPAAGFVSTVGHPLIAWLTLNRLRSRVGLVFGEKNILRQNVIDVGCRASGVDGYLDEFRVEDETLWRKVLAQANNSVSKWSGKLYFVYLPDWHRLGAPDSANPYRDRVMNIVGSVGIRIIDMYPVFRDQPDPLDLFPFRLDGHYNEKGHRLVAQSVLQAISTDLRQVAP